MSVLLDIAQVWMLVLIWKKLDELLKEAKEHGFTKIIIPNANQPKTKLNGIEASADVTDATNVDAAGAVMNSDLATKGQEGLR